VNWQTVTVGEVALVAIFVVVLLALLHGWG
jgi:hypothetical protein